VSQRKTRGQIQQILNVQDGAFADVDLMGSVRILCQVLSIGLVSFSGSHVPSVDPISCHQIDTHVSQRKTRGQLTEPDTGCALGGPAWVLSKDRYPAETLEHPRRPNGGYGPPPQGRDLFHLLIP
jgi:hypothetical protein